MTLLVGLAASPSTGAALVPVVQDPPAPEGWETLEEFRGMPVEEYRKAHGNGRLSLIGYRTPDGVLHGPEWTFWPNGSPRIKRVWASAKLDGAYQAWFKGGTTRMQGTYEADERVGRWLRYSPTGALVADSEYRAGNPHGQFLEFYANGKRRSERHFDAGLQVGVERQWTANGHLDLEGTWSAGKRHGPWMEIARRPGEITRREGPYVEDQKDGVWTTSTSEGQKLREETFVKGVLEGKRRTWRPDGTAETEATFSGGEETGPYVAWFPDGQKQMEGEKIAGRREGHWTFWKPDGSVDERFTGTYENDVRVSD